MCSSDLMGLRLSAGEGREKAQNHHRGQQERDRPRPPGTYMLHRDNSFPIQALETVYCSFFGLGRLTWMLNTALRMIISSSMHSSTNRAA